jgi:hypothetical protein
MKSRLKQLIVSLPVVTALAIPTMTMGAANAATTTDNTSTAATQSTTSPTAASKSAAETATRLANIKAKGDSEIDRRLKTLNGLLSRISGATKLTSSDKAALTTEVNNEIAGLTSLRTTLDAETTVAAAAQDVANMVTEYRVYALIVPKVQLVRMADDQQIVEGKLSALQGKLTARIAQAQKNGKDVSTLTTQLAEMTSHTTMAQQISSQVETSVLALQPVDYNTNHTLLNGYHTQLMTAHTDNETAYNDAKTIITDLKAF